MDNNKFIPRDLSWLSFNERILLEAAREKVPLYERIKFLAIYSANLYEFYRVRVATLRRIASLKSNKIDKKLKIPAAELLTQIEQTVNQQLDEYGKVIQKSIIPALAEKDIHLYFNKPIPKGLWPELRHYFRSQVLAFLTPVYSNQLTEQSYHLQDHRLYLVFDLEPDGSNKNEWAYVNIPSELPRFFLVPTEQDGYHVVWLDDIIRLHADYLFPKIAINGSYSVVLSRDADLQIEDEYEGNLVEKIRKQLAKRDLGPATRFLYDPQLPRTILKQLQQYFRLSSRDLVSGGHYHNLNDLFELPNPGKPDLEYEPYPPLRKTELDQAPRLLGHLEEQDELLMFPYHSYDYVLQLFNEAAVHPEVTEINVTLYRIAKNSLIAQALISAARNGKQVRVFVEVKARFDEENNLRWAGRMEDAGVKIVYSMPELKVHSKIGLIKRVTNQGKTYHYAYLGTGNFNEKTARVYSDLALLTSDAGMTKDVERVFGFLYKQKKIKSIQHLLVAPFSLKSKLLAYIDREIEWVKKGQQAGITLKLNALEDKEMIDKLYDASRAGVQVTLLIRGICCLRPQVAGLSENIRVIRLVDRFLEHTRVYLFHNNGSEEIYLASADWMQRNLHRRVEVAFSVLDTTIRQQIKQMLDFQLRDNEQAVLLDENLQNGAVNDGEEKLRAQEAIYRWLAKEEGKKLKY